VSGDNRAMSPAASPPLILASTSRYRRELLERLRMPFEARSPEVDETPLPGEPPAALAERLALEKARALARLRPEAVVIGADQVADVDGTAIGKPGTHERATAQLRAMSGRRIVFQTAVAVVRPATGFAEVRRVPVTVRFRALDDAEIEFYLRTEQPYDCAGSAKCETLGIALLEAIESDDPTALIGLPLIQTSALLRAAGLDPLRPAPAAAR
jgi:septum formation protein